MPKGVMWRQDDLIKATHGTNPLFLGPDDYNALGESLTGPGLSCLPACPLMHGTGQFTAFIAMSGAGSITTLESRHLDIPEMLDAVERFGIQTLTIVGDAFAKPILRALDDSPGKWDLSSLIVIASSGVMWSEPVKQIDDDGNDVEPGSGASGRVAVRGYTPVGYYKDPEKSAATFVTLDGETYSIPGDYACVEADGSLTLLGRGSVCINTGGEKVFPEEVEEVLKAHDTVFDAVAVGLPDEKFGEAITAVVQLKPGEELDARTLINHVKDHLASYKAPKMIVTIDTIGRAPNGKVDYKRMRQYAADELRVALG
jgi:fatty-acyl-CoA synthase